MSRLFSFITFIALLLAACATPAESPTTAPTVAPTSAPATLPPTQAPTPAPPTSTVEASPAPIENTPTVEPTAATSGARVFVIQSSTSSASYAVGEIFIDRGNRYNLAIGTTNVIAGEITLDAAHPDQTQVGPITIDISQLQSDSGRRDRMIRENWLESATFPIATFTPTKIEGLPATYTPGTDLTFMVTGDFLIRDVTRSTTFTVTAKLDGDTLSGVATTLILMTDFGFTPPDIIGILKAENEAKLEFKFIATPKE